MKWLYILAGAACLVKMLLMPDAVPVLDGSIVQKIMEDTGVSNAVTGIILHNRLYDTIFEVLVFTMAILGSKYLLADEKPVENVYRVDDPPSIALARLGAVMAAIVGIELAIRGHISPGGGFAAGVAGGTAIGLMAITSPPEWMDQMYRRWKAERLEKLSVLLFIGFAAMTLAGIELPFGAKGALFSGGIIPALNVLVAIKVALGSWSVILLFIRYKGLL